MKLCELSQCSFQNWYPKFRHCSILAEYEPIPNDVLEYLRNDNVTVPTEAVLECDQNDSDGETSSINWDSGDEDQPEIIPPSFPDFSNKIKNIIESMGGAVFVKLNWSSPSDAAWVATNSSLRCTNLQDLYLLLKSSDKIAKDLSQDYRHSGPKFYLVLKKWKNIRPESEFRCFITNDNLVAISQRNKVDYHDQIALSKVSIVSDITRFYNNNIKGKFTLANFCLDVARSAVGIVKIIDIQPLDQSTNTYLYTADEINQLEYTEGLSPEFRYIAEHTWIQPNNLQMHFGMPREMMELSDSMRNDIIRFLQERASQDYDDYSDEE